jgi:sugar phosphate isomerase/epimerase
VRVAAHTYPYRDLPLEDALDELAGLEFFLVEVWLGHAAGGPDGVARALRERGLEAVAVSAGGFYTVDTDAVPRAIELAQAVGASMIVACVALTVLGTVLERMPAGTTLCAENHWDQRLATSRDMRAVLDAYPGMAVCLDTGHAILAGEPPERFVAALGDGVKHVHLKDAANLPLRERFIGRRLRTRFLPRPQTVMPGDGALDVSRIRRALEDVGYAGAVTLEHEGVEPSVALERLRTKWASSGEPSTIQA